MADGIRRHVAPATTPAGMGDSSVAERREGWPATLIQTRRQRRPCLSRKFPAALIGANKNVRDEAEAERRFYFPTSISF